jgi:hypothetical protein
VINAWRLKFIGKAHKCLLGVVDEVQHRKEDSSYAKIVPITQSSGMGKSKTVDAIAQERILFPLCLRENLGADSFGARHELPTYRSLTSKNLAFPPPDVAVRNFLLQAPSAGDQDKCKTYLRTFLRSLFESALEQVKKFETLREKSTYIAVVGDFYDIFRDQGKRNSFYEGVINRCDEKRDATQVDTWDAIRSLVDALSAYCSDWDVGSCPILISLDEVHVLFEPRTLDAQSSYTLYSRLKSVLSDQVKQPFCVLSLSTVSKVSKLAPSKSVADSLRVQAVERIISPPFTELPFDVHIIEDPLVSGKETIASVGSFEFAAKFGRPMYVHSNLVGHEILTSISEVLCDI